VKKSIAKNVGDRDDFADYDGNAALGPLSNLAADCPAAQGFPTVVRAQLRDEAQFARIFD